MTTYTMVNEFLELTYSPDDGGWYFTNLKDDERTSITYGTKSEAMSAYRASSITWE